MAPRWGPMGTSAGQGSPGILQASGSSSRFHRRRPEPRTGRRIPQGKIGPSTDGRRAVPLLCAEPARREAPAWRQPPVTGPNSRSNMPRTASSFISMVYSSYPSPAYVLGPSTTLL